MAELPSSYTLRVPIERKSIDSATGTEHVFERIETVSLRRLKGKDMRIIDQLATTPMAMTLALIGKMTGLSAAEVDELDAEDVGELGNLVERIMPAGPSTGGTS